MLLSPLPSLPHPSLCRGGFAAPAFANLAVCVCSLLFSCVVQNSRSSCIRFCLPPSPVDLFFLSHSLRPERSPSRHDCVRTWPLCFLPCCCWSASTRDLACLVPRAVTCFLCACRRTCTCCELGYTCSSTQGLSSPVPLYLITHRRLSTLAFFVYTYLYNLSLLDGEDSPVPCFCALGRHLTRRGALRLCLICPAHRRHTYSCTRTHHRFKRGKEKNSRGGSRAAAAAAAAHRGRKACARQHFFLLNNTNAQQPSRQLKQNSGSCGRRKLRRRCRLFSCEGSAVLAQLERKR